MRVFMNADELRAAVGQPLGFSDWQAVTQEQVDTFADATGDRQWIHCDPERAKDGPYGATIAHGYLTLSLLPVHMAQVFRVDGARMKINYGLNKVRFPSPVVVGSRLRVSCEFIDVRDIPGGVELTTRSTIEIDGATKPACVAETVGRNYF